LRADDSRAPPFDHGCMTTSEYIVNAVFVLLVLRQAHERRLDLSSFLVPLGIVLVVAHQYVHSLPTAGNDLVLISVLASVGLASGLVSGFATRLRIENGVAFARVGMLAGSLLIAGISARMIFAFAVTHGAQPHVRDFSIAYHIGPTAWPVALVSMALLEVVARVMTVRVRSIVYLR
jgi:hypothetical protein